MAYSRETRWQCAALLAGGSTQVEAAKAISIPLRTVQRWMSPACPRFRQLVHRLRAVTLSAAMGKLTDLAGKAVAKFGELIDSGTTESIQLKAAEAALSSLLKLRNDLDLAQQIADLQDKLDGKADPNPAKKERHS